MVTAMFACVTFFHNATVVSMGGVFMSPCFTTRTSPPKKTAGSNNDDGDDNDDDPNPYTIHV